MNLLRIRQDDPASDGLRQLLREHLEHMRRITPPGHVHASCLG